MSRRGFRVELGGVEAALYRHPAIHGVAVLPVPDKLLGSRLRAVVVADELGSLTRREVVDHCRQQPPAYMGPDVVELRAALPRTISGKIGRGPPAARSTGPGLAGHGA